MKIVIAEDDPITQHLLQALVQKWGHEALLVSDGRAALEILQREGDPPLAVLDWMMPGMTGIEVCRKIRETMTTNQPYILLLTASRVGKEDVIAGLEAGADDFLTKPFEPPELHARLATGMRILRLQAELRARITELEDALTQVKTLKGLLPVCAWCRKLRDDAGYWQELEVYIMRRTDAQFSHGICPNCLKKYYPDFAPSILSQGPGKAPQDPNNP